MHVRFYLTLPISVTVCIFTVSAFISLTLTLNIPNRCTAIPHHIIINPNYCAGYTALVKTLHSHLWCDVVPCHYYPYSLNNTFIFFAI